jgi:hypothetical protein
MGETFRWHRPLGGDPPDLMVCLDYVGRPRHITVAWAEFMSSKTAQSVSPGTYAVRPPSLGKMREMLGMTMARTRAEHSIERRR